MSAPKRRAADPTTMSVRLIQRCASTAPGAVAVGGTWLRALPLNSLNGDRGFQVGHFEQWLGVEGPWSLDLPNTAGPDGHLHINRFLQITDPQWQPGDEFVEIRRDSGMTHLFTGALIDRPSTTLGKIQVSGFDGMWLLKKVRETEAGFWCHSPRDVLEHYTRLWGVFDVASAFPEPGAAVITTASGTPIVNGIVHVHLGGHEHQPPGLPTYPPGGRRRVKRRDHEPPAVGGVHRHRPVHAVACRSVDLRQRPARLRRECSSRLSGSTSRP